MLIEYDQKLGVKKDISLKISCIKSEGISVDGDGQLALVHIVCAYSFSGEYIVFLRSLAIHNP
jgi:hypothetical protein